ncbi:hypothetical protein NX722_16575 [Endozoicomonas gorgoniicola]|uniref:Uncharacterized protein n=1 Tax=Endozoicomonas gorgoniicola TaxID=1234144 RepID=A0ABT3MXU8_9GAMM|nr:hypothetical protein [Endozoicomonas gorgoniicola]MCW7554205.1 hypothetical protein [Endozoicomonas gorgoniicola]
MTHPKGLCIHVLAVLLLFMPVHASGLLFVFKYEIKPNNAKPFTARVEITCPDPADQPQVLPVSSASTPTGTIQITTILTTESEQSDTASSSAGNGIRRIHYSLQPLPPEQIEDSETTYALLNDNDELIQQVTLDPFTLQLLEGIETLLTPAEFQQAIRAGSQPFFLALLPALIDSSSQIDYPVYQSPDEPPGSGNQASPMGLALQTFPDTQETAIIHYENFLANHRLASKVEHMETSTNQSLFTITLMECGEITSEASDTEASERTPAGGRYASSDSQNPLTASHSDVAFSGLLTTLRLILTTTQLRLSTTKPPGNFFRGRSSSI